MTALEKELELEQERLQRWRKEIDRLPSGTLHFTFHNGRCYFYRMVGKKRKGISLDTDLVYQLARKRYLLLLRKTHEKKLRHILRGGKTYGEDGHLQAFLENCVRAGLDLLRITCSEEQYRWVKDSYDKNPKEFGDRVYRTYSGVEVRSKSEQAIGNALERYGIPYRYEPGVRLDVSVIKLPGVDSFKTYYPDFVILTASGDCLIWEHLGMVDLPAYRAHNMEKIAAYRQGGLLGVHELVLTFERDLEDANFLDRFVSQTILPQVI